MTVLFIIGCSKKDAAVTTSMNSDSLVSDSSAAIPNPAPQTDSATTMMSNTDSSATAAASKRDSAK